MDRIIDGLEDTHAEIEKITNDRNESYYHDGARETNIDSKELCNDEDKINMK